jgi:hypothetical protein
MGGKPVQPLAFSDLAKAGVTAGVGHPRTDCHTKRCATCSPPQWRSAPGGARWCLTGSYEYPSRRDRFGLDDLVFIDPGSAARSPSATSGQLPGQAERPGLPAMPVGWLDRRQSGGAHCMSEPIPAASRSDAHHPRHTHSGKPVPSDPQGPSWSRRWRGSGRVATPTSPREPSGRPSGRPCRKVG